jgi:2-deoxy-D-gluconate 3-dehydrogenase
MIFPSFDLSNKVAVVTGGGSGIGRATALSLSHFGATVAVADKNIESAREVASDLQEAGGSSLAVEVDVCDLEQIKRMTAEVVGALGGIDILVNNAAIVIGLGPAEDVTPESWDKTMSTNLRGLFFCSQSVGKSMIDQERRGKIVNIAAVSAIMALRPLIGYNSSKGGVMSLTRTLATEWAKYGINVNAVAPTFIETPATKSLLENDAAKEFFERRIPLGRLGRPEDIAGAVLYLASPAADLVTGHTVVVDGGWTAGEPWHIT